MYPYFLLISNLNICHGPVRLQLGVECSEVETCHSGKSKALCSDGLLILLTDQCVVLKQLYKDERLSFVSCLLAKKYSCAIDHATEAAIHDLISAGNLKELQELAEC